MQQGDEHYLREAIALARHGMERNEGGPFGCLVVKDGNVVTKGNNRVTSTNDPTAHAEMVAIRAACKALGEFQLTGCTLYTSCEPCPMCLGAIYWARPDRVVFAGSRINAAEAGFDDQLIYDELMVPFAQRRIPMIQGLQEEAVLLFQAWNALPDKLEY